MIPSRDRVGQIGAYTRWLENRLGAKVQGAWIPERVWEQSLTADLVAAGVRYTVLDDYHFKNAGLHEDELYGYFLTEDDGQLLSVFPGSERLRYLIPFGQPHETTAYLRDIAERHPGSVVVFGDDGEKFGTWPETKKHVYNDGWLRRFFDELMANREWIHVTTLAEAAASTPPRGKALLAGCQLPRNDRMGAARRSADGLRGLDARSASRSALAGDPPLCAGRILAELQSPVPRSERDVRPDDDGQPPPRARGARGVGRRDV